MHSLLLRLLVDVEADRRKVKSLVHSINLTLLDPFLKNSTPRSKVKVQQPRIPVEADWANYLSQDTLLPMKKTTIALLHRLKTHKHTYPTLMNPGLYKQLNMSKVTLMNKIRPKLLIVLRRISSLISMHPTLRMTRCLIPSVKMLSGSNLLPLPISCLPRKH